MGETKTAEERHHYIRTVLASIFGGIALWLIVLSMLIIWANRTLTNTDSYVSTVAPIISEPEVQNFFADRLSSEVSRNVSSSDLATGALSDLGVDSSSTEQAREEIRAATRAAIVQVISSDSTRQLWEDTNTSMHRQLMANIKSGNGRLELDFTPVLLGLSGQLQQTKLAPLASEITNNIGSGKVVLEGKNIQKVYDLHAALQRTTVIVLVLAIFFTALSVVISVHHAKTLRRIALGVGVSMLLLGASLWYLPALNITAADATTRDFALVVSRALTHGLLLVTLISGATLVGISLLSKLVAHSRRAKV